MSGILKQLSQPAGTTLSAPSIYSGGVATLSADYPILDNDGYDVIFMTTGASTRTVTLPVAANNSGRVITIMKADSGAGKITVSRGSSDNIDAYTTTDIGTGAANQYAWIQVCSDGLNWYVIGCGGEVIEGTGTSGTTGVTTAGNQDSIALASGEWDVTANFIARPNTATGISSSDLEWAISLNSASFTGCTFGSGNYTAIDITAGGTTVWRNGSLYRRVNLTAAQSVYLVLKLSAISANSIGIGGRIRARRIR